MVVNMQADGDFKGRRKESLDTLKQNLTERTTLEANTEDGQVLDKITVDHLRSEDVGVAPESLYKFIDSQIFNRYDFRNDKRNTQAPNYHKPKFVNLEQRPPTLVYKQGKTKSRTRGRKRLVE